MARHRTITHLDIIPSYIDGVVNKVNVLVIKNKRFNVVIDTGCGAGSVVTPFMLSNLGCRVTTLNAQIDRTFPSRHPELTEEALSDLSAAVVALDADIGIAHDGDADRSVFMDEHGNFINEDVLLSIIIKHALSWKKGIVVTPVSSSQRIVDIAKEAESSVIWTPVGSIHVARTMKKLGAVIGGEGNVASSFRSTTTVGMEP